MLARSRLDTLPIPGIVLGSYPERGKQAPADTLLKHARAVPRPFRRRSHWDVFIGEVRARQEVLEPLSDGSLARITKVTRKHLFSEGFAEGLLAQGAACVCEASRRTLGLMPYETQLIAARLMLDNHLAEMATGEGKTLASAVAAGIAAMAGIPVHCITANDYLVTRDAQQMRPLYEKLGVSVGTVTQRDDAPARRAAYACDITYCTAKELVFDYLKDSVQMGRSKHDLLHRAQTITREETGWQPPFLRGLCMAIVDEADSVLLDEAGTPFILARPRPASDQPKDLLHALRIARNLRPQRHYLLSSEHAELTEQAKELLAKLAGQLTGLWRHPRRREEVMAQALAALHLFHRDRHYVLRAGKVCIIDQTTGRLGPGRVWSRGLHQLIELKEGCEITGAQDTIAQITFQRFFPRYLRLAGTSGTLSEARRELKAGYRLGVRRVPLRCPSQRRDLGTRVYTRRESKWRQVIESVKHSRHQDRPILIGTDSVADSEQLSALLTQAGLAHQTLNARQDHAEAQIIASAGEQGAITVATNMAGRGTDIALGKGVAALGGLHVISCQLNTEARIDRQLHGRAGRQGDPGTVETVLCLQEPLIERWMPAWLRRPIVSLAPQDGVIPWCIASALIRVSQWLEEVSRRAQRRNLVRLDAFNESRLSISGFKE